MKQKDVSRESSAREASAAVSLSRPLMVHLKRGSWLAAWCVWVWLGFGLHRELPRDLGPEVCRLPIPQGASVLGYVAGTNLVVVNPNPQAGTTVEVFDAETGKKTLSFSGRVPRWYVDNEHHSISRGFLVIDSPLDAKGKTMEGYHRLNLHTGELKRLTHRGRGSAILHDHRPWLLIADSERKPRDKIVRVLVVDVETGREVFHNESSDEREIAALPTFPPGADKLLIPTTTGGGSPAPRGLEVWTLSPAPVMEKLFKGVVLQSRHTASSNGRIAQLDDTGAEAKKGGPPRSSMEVFDANEGRIVFSLPRPQATSGGGDLLRQLGGPWISRDGRSVIAGDPIALWEIDTGRMLWQAAEHETPVPYEKDLLMVFEDWGPRLPDWLAMEDFLTVAFRSMSTGELVARVNATILGIPNKDDTLAVVRGVVHRLPYRVNWPLLAFCQTILSMPLLLLWALLRWRRKRRLPREVVQS